MSLLSRTRCCVIGVLITHGILLLGITLALVVAMVVYGDVMVQDMPTDMRRLQLGKSSVFCQKLIVTASPERENDADYQTLPLFDAWSVSRDKMDDVKTKHLARVLSGQNRLEGQAKDYYSFYWMNGSTIDVQLNVTARPEPTAAYWVYFLQGASAWDSMDGHLLDDPATKPSCAKDSCLMSEMIPKGGLNVSLLVNTTDEYYMVFYTNYTGDNRSNSAAVSAFDVVDDADNEDNSLSVDGSSVAKPAPLGTVWYKLNLNLSAYETDDPTLKTLGTSQSEVGTRDVDSFIILDFMYGLNHSSTDLKDFSNIVVSVECEARVVTYVAVFGFVALALIIFTVIITLCIINKRFSEDPDQLNIGSGDYTRLVTDA